MQVKWNWWSGSLTAVACLYLVLCLELANAPLMDLPNHLARAHIIADFIFSAGRTYGDAFTFQLEWAPYLFGDLILASIDHAVGLEWASRLWSAVSVFVLPFAVWFALGAQGCSRRARTLGALLAFYLATDWFFVSGFLNYRIAVACVVFAYGWFLKAEATRSPRAYAWYVLLLIAGYAMHLSALVLTGTACGTVSALLVLRGRQSLTRATVLLLPVLLLLGIHFGFSGHHAAGSLAAHWGTWDSKLRRLASPIVRFDAGPELLLFTAFLACVIVPVVWGGLQRCIRHSAEQVVLALMFTALYFALPLEYGLLYDVDNRALPLAALFLLFVGCRSLEQLASPPKWLPALAVIVSCANLLYLGVEILPQDRSMALYRTIARRAPRGSVVLPVNTRPEIGRYQAFPHAGSFATIEAAAITPYLFSGPTYTHIGYFRYRQHLDAPSLFWYTRSDDIVDWNEVRRGYDYLLITRPYDPDRIPIPNTIVTANAVAALVKVQK